MTARRQPPCPADQATIVSLTQQALAHLDNVTDPRQVPSIIASALRAAIEGERRRAAEVVRDYAAECRAGVERSAKAGLDGNGKMYARHVDAATHLAAAIEAPPAPSSATCATCRGARVVPSRVVLAGGAPTMVPCDACASPQSPGAPPGSDAPAAPAGPTS